MQIFPGFNPISAHSYIGVQPVKRRVSPNDTVRAQLGAAAWSGPRFVAPPRTKAADPTGSGGVWGGEGGDQTGPWR